MNRERQRQARALTQLLAGKLTTGEAAEIVGRSVRWVERQRPRFREKGVEALLHGNSGKRPSNAIGAEIRDKVIRLATNKYRGFNLKHLCEMLNEVEGLRISPRSVHRICTQARIASPRAHKRRVLHRKRRQRSLSEGDMVQMDGSPHDWLEGRGPRLTLITAIDDATGHKWAEFREGEDLEGYMRVFREIAETKGIPGSIYTDRSVIVAGISAKYKPWHDEPAGPSQFARALEELGVTVILANSPQAKGRVERSHGVDQDRLCSVLRLAEAATRDEANKVLKSYLRDANRRFKVKAANPPAWQPKPRQHLGDILCIKEERTVSNDNTVRIYGQIHDIPPTRNKASYSGKRVVIHRRFDQTIGIYLDGRRIAGEGPGRSRSSAMLSSPQDLLAS